MNPYDEFVVVQALLVKAANAGANVTVLRVGGVKDTEALRTAMAMGADDAILVEAEDNLDSYSIAKSLKGAIEKSGKQPSLILCGKQAIDDDCLQVPQILAEMMNLPSVAVIVGFEQNGDSIKGETIQKDDFVSGTIVKEGSEVAGTGIKGLLDGFFGEGMGIASAAGIFIVFIVIIIISTTL